MTGVTGPSALLYFKKERIPITIGEPTNEFLCMPARFALKPKLLPGSTPIMHQASSKRAFDTVTVHPGHHQNTAGRIGFAHNSRNQPIFRKAEIGVHYQNGRTKPASAEEQVG